MNNERKDLDVLLGAIREKFGEDSSEYSWLEKQIGRWAQDDEMLGANGVSDTDDDDYGVGLSELAKGISKSNNVLTSSQSLSDVEDISFKLDISRLKYLSGCIEIPVEIEITQKVDHGKIKYVGERKYKATLATVDINNAIRENSEQRKNITAKELQKIIEKNGKEYTPVYIQNIKYEKISSALTINDKVIRIRANTFIGFLAFFFFGKKRISFKVYSQDEIFGKLEGEYWYSNNKKNSRFNFKNKLRYGVINFNNKLKAEEIRLGEKGKLIIYEDKTCRLNKELFNR